MARRRRPKEGRLVLTDRGAIVGALVLVASFTRPILAEEEPEVTGAGTDAVPDVHDDLHGLSATKASGPRADSRTRPVREGAHAGIPGPGSVRGGDPVSFEGHRGGLDEHRRPRRCHGERARASRGTGGPQSPTSGVTSPVCRLIPTTATRSVFSAASSDHRHDHAVL